MWCRAGNRSAVMLTSACHEQLEELLKQVLALIELLHYDQIPKPSSSSAVAATSSPSSSSSSSRHPISRALRKLTGRQKQQEVRQQHHHDNRHHDNHQWQQQQDPTKENEDAQPNNNGKFARARHLSPSRNISRLVYLVYLFEHELTV